jgi:hypothetical protein
VYYEVLYRGLDAHIGAYDLEKCTGVEHELKYSIEQSSKYLG